MPNARNASVTWDMVLQPDQKIVLAGTCARRACVARYRPDGSLDDTFGNAGTIAFDMGAGYADIRGVALGAAGTLFVTGSCDPGGGSTLYCVARLLANGQLDATFGIGGLMLYMMGGSGRDFAQAATVQRDGKLLVAGGCWTEYVGDRLCVLRLGQGASPDTTFASNGRMLRSIGGGEQSVTQITQLPDGKLLLAGYCYRQWIDFCLARLNADGTVDSSFGQNGSASTDFPEVGLGTDRAWGVAVHPDGRLTLAGSCSSDNRDYTCLARFTGSGQLDTRFNGTGRRSIPLSGGSGIAAMAVILQPDDKFVTAGFCEGGACLMRFNADGSFDPSFGTAGVALLRIQNGHTFPTALAAQADGKLVVGGWCGSNFCLARFDQGEYTANPCKLNANGALRMDAGRHGTLSLRYLFGVRGGALAQGLPGFALARTGQPFEDYFSTLDFDADGDGQSLATTDGLLILRALLGLTGDALIAGATNAAHPNVRNAQQILSWIEATHGAACLP